MVARLTRMVLQGELAIGGLDLVARRRSLQNQDLIRVNCRQSILRKVLCMVF